jgi:hypothetical protein
MKKKSITYYTGAGASYNAMPVLDELGTWMILVSQDACAAFEAIPSPPGVSPLHLPFGQLLQKIEHYGRISNDFGTIDTYAKRLHWLGKDDELKELKACLSLFFSIIQLVDKMLLGSNIYPSPEPIGVRRDPIDKRYLALLSTVLEAPQKQVRLQPHVKFITWNYDLQIELAFQKFSSDAQNWAGIRSDLGYRFDSTEKLNVCHLNGYHGHLKVSHGVVQPIFQNIDASMIGSLSMQQALIRLEWIGEKLGSGEASYASELTYAWEENSSAQTTRLKAEEIMRTTDELVVVGYSIPSFNHEVDLALFRALKAGAHVVYQDKNGLERVRQILNSIGKTVDDGKDYMSTSDDKHKVKLTHISDIGQFYLPYTL